MALLIPFRRIATAFEFRHRQFAVEATRGELTAASGRQFTRQFAIEIRGVLDTIYQQHLHSDGFERIQRHADVRLPLKRGIL